MRCAFDGSDLETLMQTGDWHENALQVDQTNWPVCITADPTSQVFYWT